jgi:hypothetical protein
MADAQCWRTAMNLASQLPANPDASARVLRYMRALLDVAEGHSTNDAVRRM